jgi:hypothetical protein
MHNGVVTWPSRSDPYHSIPHTQDINPVTNHGGTLCSNVLEQGYAGLRHAKGLIGPVLDVLYSTATPRVPHQRCRRGLVQDGKGR